MKVVLVIILSIVGIFAYPDDITSMHISIRISKELESNKEPLGLKGSMLVIRNASSNIIIAVSVVDKKDSLEGLLVEEALAIKASAGSNILSTSSLQVSFEKNGKGRKRFGTVLNVDDKEYSIIKVMVEEIGLDKYGIKRIYSNSYNTYEEIEYMNEVVEFN